MLTIGITGQVGFIGTHLFNQLNLCPEEFKTVEFKDDYFNNPDILKEWTNKCDVIVHLAAMNRHNDPEVLYKTNIDLVHKLIESMKSCDSKAHVIFSSSTQEERDNLYGKSKRECREILNNFANENNSLFTGLVIPNVYGPFGNPYYNSFIATFSHQLTHEEQPEIHVDGSVNLIYVSNLCNKIIHRIRECRNNNSAETKKYLSIPYDFELKVSEILKLLEEFRNHYFINNVIPSLNNSNEINLFNTFRSYMDHKNRFPVMLTKHSDSRGMFVETIRLGIGGQVSFSTTVPGITRGNHYHTRKIERFAVIKGKALIQLRKIGSEEIYNFELDGKNPSFVDMPVWYTHNIKNIGDEEVYTIFWINEFFDKDDPDTYFEEV
jgi:UDP-2-acetamido-2,6-beta-L-arabino-hexul-4-ose reductase